jgi:isocitrate dehydrogenase kinase/phosphatase
MQPLNLYVEDCRRTGDREALRWALRDYGQAIKELAGAGIFPGDMLLKNFGVTRHDRVVFYDYDEIQPIGEMNFLRIPPARTYEEEMSAEPYWRIGEHDVFPEQFDRFLVSEPRARQVFYEYHRDLLSADFWKEKQELVRTGEQEDVFPYAQECRFKR